MVRFGARLLAGMAYAGVMFAGAGTVAAAPLAKEACDILKTEHDRLTANGVKDAIAKGPATAKADLKPDRLAEIRRYIEVEEQLLFRCGLAKARYVAPAELEVPPPAAEPEKAPPKAKPKPKPKEKAAALPAGAPNAGATPGSQIAPTQTVQAKTVQAKPKPKADDAFRPVTAAEQPK